MFEGGGGELGGGKGVLESGLAGWRGKGGEGGVEGGLAGWKGVGEW